MAAIAIRGIDETLKKKLRIQAALHGRSMEEEARDILRSVLFTEVPNSTHHSLLGSIRTRVKQVGGIDIALPARDPIRSPPEL